MSLQYTDPLGTTDGYSMDEQTTAVDDVSIGFWVWADDSESLVKVYNGDAGGTGYGITMQGTGVTTGYFSILFGGVTWFELTPMLLNQWQSAILVCSSGTWQFYLNGSAAGPSTTTVPNTPSGTGGFSVYQAAVATTGIIKAAEAFIYDRPLTSEEITMIGADRYSPLFVPKGLLRYIPGFFQNFPEPTGVGGLFGGDNTPCPLLTGGGSTMSKGDHPDIRYPGLSKIEGLFRKF